MTHLLGLNSTNEDKSTLSNDPWDEDGKEEMDARMDAYKLSHWSLNLNILY